MSMKSCSICKKEIAWLGGYADKGKRYCKDCWKSGRRVKKGETKIDEEKKKVPTKAEIKKYKKYIKAGMGEYLLTQGGKMGILFAGIMFLFDYFGVFGGKVQGAGMYLFLGIFFGVFVGLWGWYAMNKKVRECGRK